MNASPLLKAIGIGVLWFFLSATAWICCNSDLEFIYINF